MTTTLFSREKGMKRFAALLILVGGVQHFDASAEVPYELRAAHSGKCAHVQGASRSNGGRISQWTCNADHANRMDGAYKPFFKWQKIDRRGGWFKLQSVHSKKCAQVDQASNANGAPITQWDCANQDNVYWKQQPAEHGTYFLVNKASGKCMHVSGGGHDNGAVITQWACVNQPNVKWKNSIRLAEPVGIPAND